MDGNPTGKLPTPRQFELTRPIRNQAPQLTLVSEDRSEDASSIVLVPCCQAEVAAELRKHKQQALKHPIAELWRHPIHTREFGSHVTNVLRCLQLEAHGYEVTVTELVGWEHSMKNELIIARFQPDRPRQRAGERLTELLHTLGLETLSARFFTD